MTNIDPDRRETYPTPEDAIWRLQGCIYSLTYLADGVCIPLDFCSLTDAETQCIRAALDLFDKLKVTLNDVIVEIERRRGAEGNG